MDTKALRQKILDLAIRGKLVPQDPNDEPASVLLERIRTEKQQMVKDGRLKAKDIKNDSVIYVGEDNLHYEKFADGTVKCIEDEIPFEVPEGWEWARLSSICILNPKNNINDDSEVSFIPMSLIEDGFSNKHSFEIKKWFAVKTGFTHFAENDIAVAKITPCFENRKSVVLRNLHNGYGSGTTELHILRTIQNTVIPEYILWITKSEHFISKGVQNFTGAVGQQRIGKDFIASYLVPIPSYKEQKRIILTISNFFDFIASIDTNKLELHSAIQLTKSKILDLAIRGKLVPQDPNDEPASVLLERIRAEKEDLIKQGKIKRDKKESVIFKGEDNSYYEKIGDKVRCIDDELPFDLPDGWEWCRLEYCCEKEIKRGRSPKYADISNVLVFAQKCNTKYDGINMDLALYLDESELGRYNDNEYMQDMDTVINSTGTGTLGRVGIYRNTDNKHKLPIVPDSHITVIRTYKNVNSEYTYYFLKSYQHEIEKLGEGSTNQKELKPLTLKNLIIPLPPFIEQKRIVKIITLIMEILHNIETSLN